MRLDELSKAKLNNNDDHVMERYGNAIYASDRIELAEVRSLCFRGIPIQMKHIRSLVWRLLLYTLPVKRSNWDEHLDKMRLLYQDRKIQYLRNITTSGRDVQLMKEIMNDVQRTQSNYHFFSKDGKASRWMKHILFVYAKQSEEIQYIQGMNELLAPIVYVLGNDTKEEWSKHTEADAYECFSQLMEELKVIFVPMQQNKSGLFTQMNRLEVLVRQHDEELSDHMRKIGVTTEFYSLRWYATMVAREFHLPDTLRIWDSLLADKNRFSFLHYICCAMVLSQRERLLKGDFEFCLQCLQNIEIQNVEILIQQAIELRATDRKTDQLRKMNSVNRKLDNL